MSYLLCCVFGHCCWNGLQLPSTPTFWRTFTMTGNGLDTKTGTKKQKKLNKSQQGLQCYIINYEID